MSMVKLVPHLLPHREHRRPQCQWRLYPRISPSQACRVLPVGMPMKPMASTQSTVMVGLTSKSPEAAMANGALHRVSPMYRSGSFSGSLCTWSTTM